VPEAGHGAALPARRVDVARGTPGQDAVADRLVATTRVVLRPIGAPTALGMLGLAAGTFTLAGLQLGWVPAGEQDQVGLVLVVFASLLQLVAAVLSFLARDGVAGTAFGVLAGTWLAVGVVLAAGPEASASSALGLGQGQSGAPRRPARAGEAGAYRGGHP